ncbi:MAG: methyltransferase domain-containing protein [Myxococcota bacterium]
MRNEDDALERRISTELDALAPVFDEATLWAARFGILLLREVEIRPSVRGLDLGCGTGFPLLELAALHGPESTFVGVDTWPRALDVVREKVRLHRVTNVSVNLADACSLPLPDRSFDLVVSNLGVNNFHDPAAAAREAFRVCKPGGRLAVTTNPIGTMPEVYDRLREVAAQIAPGSADALRVQEQHRGSIDECERLLTHAGFAIQRRATEEFAMTFANGRALFRHVLVACFLEGWRSALADAATEIFRAAEEALTDPIRTTTTMLYLEGVRR